MKKEKFGFHNFAEHLQKARGRPVKNQCSKKTPLAIQLEKTGDAMGHDTMRQNTTRRDTLRSSIAHVMRCRSWNRERVKPKEKEKNKYEHCYIVCKHSIQLTRYVRFE